MCVACTLTKLPWYLQAHPWVRPGHLFTKGPGTYKIPTANDIPVDFRVTLLQNTPNPRAVHSSKVRTRQLMAHRQRQWHRVSGSGHRGFGSNYQYQYSPAVHPSPLPKYTTKVDKRLEFQASY